MPRLLRILILLQLTLLMVAPCRAELAGEPLLPLLPVEGLDPDKIELGRALFHDVRLSGDNTISCASCHNLKQGGVDRLPVSVGVGGALGSINAPTVYNSAYNFVQFWDGRAATLEEQAAGPVHNPLEMASNWEQVLDKLGNDAGLQERFARIYPNQGLSSASIVDAIATFERSLVMVDAPFDRYLRGDRQAISERAHRGYVLFKSYGCSACHQGSNVGGNLYQYMGVMGDYFADRGGLTQADLGRFNVTQLEGDRYLFKVPSLRLAALTPPYFHDGSHERLDDAVRTMARYQLGRIMPDDDVVLIVEFLHTLYGRLPLEGIDAH